MSTKQPVEGGEATIAAVLDESASVAVAAPEEAAQVEFAYSEWGAPGTVVFDETIEDLDIRTVRFANGLQLNLKRTDFEPGRIAFSMQIGDGLASFPKDKPGLQELLPVAIGVDGFVAHTPDELRQVLAGEQVTIGLSAANGALVASGTTTPDDLELQLDLLAARLTATAWRPETQAQLEGVIPILVSNIRSDETQVFGAAVNSVLAGGDARFGLADPNALTGVTLDDLRAAVAPQLAEGALAIGLVGDVDPDAAIDAVAATLGSLPARDIRKPSDTTAAPALFIEDQTSVILSHDGGSDQGVLALSWKTDDADDLRDDVTRDLLAAVFTLRLTETLREELGDTFETYKEIHNAVAEMERADSTLKQIARFLP